MELKNNRDLLYDLYIRQELSMSKIASIYSVSTMTIRAWLIKNKIYIRPSTVNVYREIKKTKFSEKQKDLIIGSLLGDGSITIGKDCKNARFVERHSESQKDYLVWKRNLLKPFTKSKLNVTDPSEHVISGVSCNTQRNYMFSTISHPHLTEIRNIFYNNNRKIVPENINHMLNDFSFMVWLCDDGCFTYRKNGAIYRLDLHTESFTLEENMFLCRILQDRYNPNFRINSRMYKSGKAYYLCLSGKNYLFELVERFKKLIPYCMNYKFKNYLT